MHKAICTSLEKEYEFLFNEEAIVGRIDLSKNVVYLQFDSLQKFPYCYGWHPLPLSSVTFLCEPHRITDCSAFPFFD